MKVVFFDIDGTMLDTRHSGRSAFSEALQRAFGWADGIEYIDFTGATDLDVIARIFANYGREPRDEDIELFFDILPAELELKCRSKPPIVLPGVLELLSVLGGRDDTILGLITGNIENCARIKLACAGVEHPFELGAFGHEHADRIDIARLAMKRAEKMIPAGGRIERIYIIGDSPSDMQAAKAIGATAAGVATGKPSQEELYAAGADVVLKDLSDLDQVLKLLDLDRSQTLV